MASALECGARKELCGQQSIALLFSAPEPQLAVIAKVLPPTVIRG